MKKIDVNIITRFVSHLYNSSKWVNFFPAHILLYFLLQELYTLCISLSMFFTYVSEMIVCHAIYQSVINDIWKRTVVFLLVRVHLRYNKRFIDELNKEFNYLALQNRLKNVLNAKKSINAVFLASNASNSEWIRGHVVNPGEPIIWLGTYWAFRWWSCFTNIESFVSERVITWCRITSLVRDAFIHDIHS